MNHDEAQVRGREIQRIMERANALEAASWRGHGRGRIAFDVFGHWWQCRADRGDSHDAGGGKIVVLLLFRVLLCITKTFARIPVPKGREEF